MFIKVASSLRLSGIGMPSPILWSHQLKMQRIVLLSSLLWWELGTNSLITGPGEWLSLRRFTSKLSWSWSWRWGIVVCSMQTFFRIFDNKHPINKSKTVWVTLGQDTPSSRFTYMQPSEVYRQSTLHATSSMKQLYYPTDNSCFVLSCTVQRIDKVLSKFYIEMFAFLAVELRSHLCPVMAFAYTCIVENTHILKLAKYFVLARVGTYLTKTFPVSYMFDGKNKLLGTKIRLVSFL